MYEYVSEDVDLSSTMDRANVRSQSVRFVSLALYAADEAMKQAKLTAMDVKMRENMVRYIVYRCYIV